MYVCVCVYNFIIMFLVMTNEKNEEILETLYFSKLRNYPSYDATSLALENRTHHMFIRANECQPNMI